MKRAAEIRRDLGSWDVKVPAERGGLGKKLALKSAALKEWQ